jgi:hypothetical protein
MDKRKELYLLCIKSVGIIILVTLILEPYSFVRSSHIAYHILFYFVIMHLFYARLLTCPYNFTLNALLIYGVLYGYLSALFAFLYAEIFFLVKPFSLLGLDKMINFLISSIFRQCISEFLNIIFITPILTLGWIHGILIGTLIWLLQKGEKKV